MKISYNVELSVSMVDNDSESESDFNLMPFPYAAISKASARPAKKVIRMPSKLLCDHV